MNAGGGGEQTIQFITHTSHSLRYHVSIGYVCIYTHRHIDIGTGIAAHGEGNGTPLQHSCLENLMDGEAWWAAVHGVAKSRTRLSTQCV